MDEHRRDHGGHGGEHRENSPHGHGSAATDTPSGVSVAAGGLVLVPEETRFEPGVGREWTFRILDEAGNAVTDFDELHGEPSHLIVVRRDLTRFQHRHPEMDDDGTWRVDLTLPDPGAYRAFVDASVAGRPTTLGFDLFAPGDADVAPRPDSSRRATAGDYEVELLADEVAAGEDTTLVFEVRRDGSPVSNLVSYLDALGHLVALREGDLAYLHVHPEETDPSAGRVAFRARFPTRGGYRLFLQTKPEGELTTTQFDVRIDA